MVVLMNCSLLLIDNCCFGISGSLDCYIVFWNLETGNCSKYVVVVVVIFVVIVGQMVHKIYTFSSIECFVYHSKHVYVGSGISY